MDNLLIKFLKTLDVKEKAELKDALAVEGKPADEAEPNTETKEVVENDEAKVETKAEETSTEENTEPKNEPTADEEATSKTVSETEEETVVEPKEEDVQSEEPNADESTSEDVVEDTANSELPAIPLEDVARTSEVEDMIKSAVAPLMARIDELVKTNTDLADENAELKDKFMNGDFGNVRPKNVGDGEQKANHVESLDEYNKRFFG